MDLLQRKLTREEWNGIEIPIKDKEKYILNLITRGFHNINIKENSNISIIDYLKINKSIAITVYIYDTYLLPKLINNIKKYNLLKNLDYKITLNESKSGLKLKTCDTIRIKNSEKYLLLDNTDIFEFKLIDECLNMLHLYNLKHNHNQKQNIKTSSKTNSENTSGNWLYHYYTLKILLTYSIKNINECIIILLNRIFEFIKNDINIKELFKLGKDLIERNPNILKYADNELYQHQKELFTLSKNNTPKLILYIAPTGTGKTLSPLGLSENHKIIFVCAARHVGLSLARNAISIGKKIAFAFGCSAAEDIRLHYYAAKEYTVNKKTGHIFKVDNTIGDKVEIIISDIKSYIPAMLYMLAFNSPENIILYWDEPTITMDYDEHPLHEIIQKNWSENLIPNIVLSSATLPFQDEIGDVLIDFKQKFRKEIVNDKGNIQFIEPEIHSITSYDCKKTIPIINKDGFIEMPHYLSDNYDKIKEIAKYCEKNKTLLRYIDLNECINFCLYINENDILKNEIDFIEHERNFPTIESINMQNIKMYYLKLLKKISKNKWESIYSHFIEKRNKLLNSSIYITTQDSYSLTDGPTIYLVENTDTISNFCLQSSNIPSEIIDNIKTSITHNNNINYKINILEKELEDLKNKLNVSNNDEKSKYKTSDEKSSPEIKKIEQKMEEYISTIKIVSLNSLYIPNSKLHIERFHPSNNDKIKNAFMCNISDNTVEEIMKISNIDDMWKVLLLMGIGVFSNQVNTSYMEIMKKLAIEQKLYLIIASTDYIYGTNYQFCHGYIGKDLSNMSQEKCIQAMGRVGRSQLQYNYSIRFRDDSLIYKIFNDNDNKPEVLNMNKLFQTIVN
jgi:hypothetical protein